jgi:pSer/pThr/pTyr-binding forkhead associated (FHA) protein
MITSQPPNVDDPTEPSVTPEMQKRLQVASKTIKVDTKNLDFETRILAGNALLQKQTTVLFALIGTEIVLALQIADRLVIGRQDFDTGVEVDIDLVPYGAVEKGVSRRHACLYRTPRTMSLIDLNSSNGTYLNGTRLVPHQPRLLRDGDAICFGNMRFHIHFADKGARLSACT